MAGLEITDDNGRVQVIDAAPLLSLKTIKNITGSTENKYITDKHLLAAKPSNGNKLLLTTLAVPYGIDPVDNEGYKFRTVGLGELFVFEYGAQPTVGASEYGLQVFDEQGVLMFSSEQKPIRLLDIITIPDIRTVANNVNGNTTYWQKNYGSKDVAVITVQYPIWTSGSNIMTAAAVSRGQIMAIESAIEWTDSELTPGITTSWSASYLVVDVTNY